MNHHPDLPDDERLRRLLEETLTDVEPHDQLDAIRNRTKGTSMSGSDSSKRPWVWGALGAAAATAAVIGGLAVLNDQEPSADPDPAGTPSATPSDPPTESTSPSPDPTSSEFTVGVYYVGDSPRGPRLYREFRNAQGATALDAALHYATSEQPLDPDYRTAWPAGIVASTAFGEVIEITLADASVRERPAGMSRAEAEIAVEQLIYTAQAAVQQRAPVQFRLADNPIDQVYGVPTAEPLAEGKVLDVMSLMNITTPEEGSTVSGTFQATGVNNGFEGSVACYIRDGNRDLWSGFGIGGFGPGKLFPWQIAVDTSGVAAGTYTFFCSDDDPSGGAEGNGPFTDTKTIIVE